jgi:hypothetical protein
MSNVIKDFFKRYGSKVLYVLGAGVAIGIAGEVGYSLGKGAGYDLGKKAKRKPAVYPINIDERAFDHVKNGGVYSNWFELKNEEMVHVDIRYGEVAESPDEPENSSEG